jgi:hypothetical protein
MSKETIHQWIYVIIPVDLEDWLTNESGPPHYQSVAMGKPLFAAFCKACRLYFTEFIPFDKFNSRISSSSLPRYGCEPISDDVQLLP